MAYDTSLEARIDEVIDTWLMGVGKRKMFGGLGYFVQGNMAFGVKDDELIVKPEPAKVDELLAEPDMRLFEFGGKTMKSWLLAGGEALADDENMVRLLEISRDFALTVPPKVK